MFSASTFSVIALPLGFVLTVILTYFLMKVGLRKGIVDIPNERSSHSLPVPRGGGLAVIITFYVFILIYPNIIDEQIDIWVWKSLSLGGAMIAAVGFIDDLNHVPARWRILVHILAAALSLSFLPSLPLLTGFGLSIDFGVFAYIFFAIVLVWFVNLFNFMDGIDGIAGAETITALGSAALILFVQDQMAWLTLMSYLAVCVAGFLVWNWPPARVFMGDACSGFLGFILGLLMVITSVEGVMNLWVWAILFGIFLVDATATLIRRVGRREKWYEAHRSHTYQILSRRFGSHQKVTIGVLIVNIFWLFPLGLLAATYSFWALPICCFALLPLLMLAVRVGAETSKDNAELLPHELKSKFGRR